MVEIFCKDCGGLIKVTKILRTPTSFKRRYGIKCPYCESSYSNQLKLRPISIFNGGVRTK